MAATYSFDAETSVATIAINDGKMNAFGFDMMTAVRTRWSSLSLPLPFPSTAAASLRR